VPERPVFVVGFHRSGTTLLQALIGAHPRIAAPPEIGFYGRVFARRNTWGDLSDDAVLRRVVAAALDRETLMQAGFDAGRVYERARAGARTYAGVFAAIMDDFAAQHDKPRWCEKTPLQPAPWIWEHFPPAQLVHIVRDPRDSVASHSKLPWDVPDPVTLARKWRAFTREAMRAGAAREPTSYLRIRYEDLAREPAAVLPQVFSFLGEDFDAGVVTDVDRRRSTVMPVATGWLGKVLEPITPPAEGAWRDTLPRAAQLRMAPIVGPLLARLGYPPSTSGEAAAGRALNAVRAPLDAGRTVARRLRGLSVRRT
jgi:LPS sulfotransferase NodH